MMKGCLTTGGLLTHRFPLDEPGVVPGLATPPTDRLLKVIVEL